MAIEYNIIDWVTTKKDHPHHCIEYFMECYECKYRVIIWLSKDDIIINEERQTGVDGGVIDRRADEALLIGVPQLVPALVFAEQNDVVTAVSLSTLDVERLAGELADDVEFATEHTNTKQQEMIVAIIIIIIIIHIVFEVIVLLPV